MHQLTSTRPWLPYCAPFFLYLGFLLIQSRLPTESLLYMYPVRAVAVGLCLLFFRRAYVELRSPMLGLAPAYPVAEGAAPSATSRWFLSVVVGLVVIVIWIGIDPYYPKLGELLTRFSLWLGRLFGYAEPPDTPPAAPFDPTTIASPLARYGFIAFRVFGAAVVVAFMEELFWRGFLIRWLVQEDFQKVPVGTFQRSGFLITVVLFGLEHEQWLAGMICGALYNWLYYRTRDVMACVVAHAVSNAALAAYVLATGEWKFW
ncbi:MAG: CAAX prenyl protease-related protein [Verrucomicrobiae bacterium]|nr:CAAX prenyl protease-related protein [Verrucomicrobiae bacterium]MDW8343976.1 CAAX prenyl protease-related protein [Verrucomicrobiae bacterium]